MPSKYAKLTLQFNIGIIPMIFIILSLPIYIIYKYHI